MCVCACVFALVCVPVCVIVCVTGFSALHNVMHLQCVSKRSVCLCFTRAHFEE